MNCKFSNSKKLCNYYFLFDDILYTRLFSPRDIFALSHMRPVLLDVVVLEKKGLFETLKFAQFADIDGKLVENKMKANISLYTVHAYMNKALLFLNNMQCGTL